MSTAGIAPTVKYFLVTYRNYLWFLFFVLVSVFFYLSPNIDLMVTGFFWNEAEGFFLKDDLWVQVIYWLFKHIPKLIIPILLGVIVFQLLKKQPWSQRKMAVFLLGTLLVGPGIIVHPVLKDSWDRARPRHVVEFGGDKVHTPAWVIADQCEKNCSFTSGHAAMGFYFLILGWLFASRKWFYIGMGIGILVGFTRIIQGGHFLSDTVLSGFIVYWTIFGFARWLNIQGPFDNSTTDKSTTDYSKLDKGTMDKATVDQDAESSATK